MIAITGPVDESSPALAGAARPASPMQAMAATSALFTGAASAGEAAEEVAGGQRQAERLQRIRDDVLARARGELLAVGAELLAVLLEPLRGGRGRVDCLVQRSLHARVGLVDHSHGALRLIGKQRGYPARPAPYVRWPTDSA